MQSEINSFKIPDFFKGYVELVEGNDPILLLKDSVEEIEKDMLSLQDADFDYSYGPGKWTIGQLIRHCIDAEMIFAFRALKIARRDPNPIQSFDENAYAAESVNQFNKSDLLLSFTLARKSTALLFKSFDHSWLSRNSLTQGNEAISVGALGIIAIGHWRHHKKILNLRYGVIFK